MTPEQIAKCGSESAHQKALFCYFAHPDVRKLYPETEWMFAIPNGGKRDARTAARMKAEGVKAGVLDIFLPHRTEHWSGLFIEMKVGDNRTSESQNKFIDYAESAGYRTIACYTWEQARDAVITYLGKRR
jgi:hypothetical protein